MLLCIQRSHRYHSGPSTRNCTWNSSGRLWSLKSDHIFLKKIILTVIFEALRFWNTAWNVSKYGVISDRIQKNMNQKQPRIWTLFKQYQDRARLYRWKIVFMGPQSSPSPPFAILLLFLLITFYRNGWNETFLIKAILDFVNPNGIFFSYIFFQSKFLGSEA